MTNEEYVALVKYKEKKVIDNDDLSIVNYLEKIKLISVDKFYANTVDGIVFNYATTTEVGLIHVERYEMDNVKPKKNWFQKIFFK